jgi:hypothetical protein
LLNGIEIGTVGWEKSQVRADGFDRGAHLGLLVDGQVVEHDDIARAERRDEDLLDIGAKTHVVDRPIKDRRRGEALESQRRDHRGGFPVAARRVIAEPLAARTPAVASDEVGGDAALIEEDVLARIAKRQPGPPASALSGDVGAALFVGVKRFF